MACLKPEFCFNQQIEHFYTNENIVTARIQKLAKNFWSKMLEKFQNFLAPIVIKFGSKILQKISNFEMVLTFVYVTF